MIGRRKTDREDAEETAKGERPRPQDDLDGLTAAQMRGRIRELRLAQAAMEREIAELRGGQVDDGDWDSRGGFRAIVEKLPLAIYVSRKIEEGCLYLNPAFVELFGYTMAEVASVEEWWRLAYPEEQYRSQVKDEWNRRVARAIETHSSIEPMETVVTCRDGSQRHMSWGYIAVGDISFAHGLDLTDRRRAEGAKAKLEAQAAYLRKSESLGRMAGAISHHFNNHLQAVMGHLELARIELTENAAAAEAMEEAVQAVRRAAEMSSLIRAYLGQTHVSHAALDLGDLCRRNLPSLQASVPAGIEMRASLPAPGPFIRANEDQIGQVLANLIANAREAIGGSPGSIRLAIGRAAATDIAAEHLYPLDFAGEEKDYACLEVADTGCGIAEERLRDIFDPFYTTKFTGRGMGLPVVQGIVRAHQGAITVESRPGQGSVFRLYLPLCAEEGHTSPEPSPRSRRERAHGTVLVVEDDEVVRRFTVAALRRMGFTVLEARDGVEAVGIFRLHHHEIRLVLCDLDMPRLDGWGTLTALRRIKPGVRVVMASGYGQAEAMAENHPELPNAYLEKPYLWSQLADMVLDQLPSTAS